MRHTIFGHPGLLSLAVGLIACAGAARPPAVRAPASEPPPAVAEEPSSTPTESVDGPAAALIAAEDVVDATLSIFAVDIGQGDATVILGPRIAGRRRALVMDAGDRAPSGGRIIEALLVAEGVTELDWVILSHFDADHLGGFVTIQNSAPLLWTNAQCEARAWFPKVAIYDQGTDTNQSKSSAEWRRCVPQVALATGTEHRHVEGGREIGTVLDFGAGVTGTIVAGDGQGRPSPRNQNPVHKRATSG